MRVFIENEAGSKRKRIHDARSLVHLRTVKVSAPYPFPYGFVLGTVGGDGDAVDCFVLTATPLSSGVTLECEPVGLIEQVEDDEIDHKVLAALPGTEPELDETTVTSIKDFIAAVFAHVPGKRIKIGRLLDRAAAEAYLIECSQ